MRIAESIPIELLKKSLFEPTPLYKFILGEIREEKRVRIPSATKKAVYERVNKRCQCCGKPLRINQGEFHHLRKPTVRSHPKFLQFLCPTCHKNYGHERKTKKVREMFETRKLVVIKRKRVRKHPSEPYWKTKKISARRTQSKKRKRK